MKMLDSGAFENATAVPVPHYAGNIDVLPTAESEFGWLKSLPIAGAVFRVISTDIEFVFSNKLFDDLAVGIQREPSLDLATLANRVNEMVDQDRESHFECWQSDDPVNHRELEITISRFGGQRDLFMLSMVDRTAEAISRMNLRREMLSDSLTGFCNRTGFEEEVEAAIAMLEHDHLDGAPTDNYAIILIDLARFSRVNESVGVLAGDELIITVARRLKSRIRKNEILCRLGGNEFALFVHLEGENADVGAIAARLKAVFADPCMLSNLEIQVECAIAGADGVVGIDDPMDTLRHAQIALKRAKLSKMFELYVAGAIDTAKHRFSLETDLRRALKRGELELHYQPLVDLGTGSLNGFEALARWQHPDYGFIPPNDFIPVAEECGLIVPLGRWALDEASRAIAKWDSKLGYEADIKISVNMSAVQMVRDDVAEAVSSAISGAGISGDRLTLELPKARSLMIQAVPSACWNRSRRWMPILPWMTSEPAIPTLPICSSFRLMF